MAEFNGDANDIIKGVDDFLGPRWKLVGGGGPFYI